MSGNQLPKSHHIVPRFYLNKFRIDSSQATRKSKIWIYPRGHSEPRCQNPSAVAVQNHFYTVRAIDGHLDPRVEQYLARIESNASRAWRAFTCPSMMTPENREILAIYIAAQLARTDRARKLVEELQNRDIKQLTHAYEMLRQESAVHGVAVAKIGNGGFHHFYAESTAEIVDHLELSSNDLVAIALIGAKESVDIVRSLQWWICIAPREHHFITSDAPVSVNYGVVPPQITHSPDINDLIITMPLSRTSGLICTNHTPSLRILQSWGTAQITKWVNHRTAANAWREVYSSRNEAWIAALLAN